MSDFDKHGNFLKVRVVDRFEKSHTFKGEHFMAVNVTRTKFIINVPHDYRVMERYCRRFHKRWPVIPFSISELAPDPLGSDHNGVQVKITDVNNFELKGFGALANFKGSYFTTYKMGDRLDRKACLYELIHMILYTPKRKRY